MLSWVRVRSFLADVLFVVAVVGGIGLVAGYAWLSQNPHHEVVRQAEDWPVVGPVAIWFGESYRSPVRVAVRPVEEPDGPVNEPTFVAGERVDRAGLPQPQPVVEGGATRPGLPDLTTEPTEPLLITRSPTDLGNRVPVDLAPAPRRPRPAAAEIAALEWRWFLPGQPLLETVGAPVVAAQLESLSYLPVLERDGAALKVVFDGEPYWADSAWMPGHDRRRSRQGGMRQRAEPYRAADGSRLVLAKRLLGMKKPNGRLGPYELWTDSTDTDLLAFLDQVASAAEAAYFSRYARTPSGDPRRSVVLFATEASYREFSPENIQLSGHLGHAGQGVLAFFDGGRRRVDLARTLVHEIAHLLNDRALALHLPQWLEEGLATDLGTVWVESTRAEGLEPARGHPHYHGLELLDTDLRLMKLGATLEAGKLPEVATMLHLEGEDFYRAENAGLAYTWGGAFVRFLLDKRQPQMHQYLGAIADGYEPNYVLFAKHFGFDDGAALDVFEQSWREWLAAEHAAAIERVERRAGAVVLR